MSKVDIRGRQGADIGKRFALQVAGGGPFDLTGATVYMQIRVKYGGDVVLDLDDMGYISITNPVGGEIEFDIPAAETDAFDWGFGYYDIRLSLADGDTIKPIYGKLTVDRGVTIE